MHKSGTFLLVNIRNVLITLTLITSNVCAAGPPPLGLDPAMIVSIVKKVPLLPLFQVKGKKYFGNPVLYTKQLTFIDPNDANGVEAELVLGATSAQAIFIVADRLIINGNPFEIHPQIRLARYEDETMPLPDGQRGSDGQPGRDGQGEGDNGAKGHRGTHGQDAKTQQRPDVYIIAYKVEYSVDPGFPANTNFGPIKIDVSGLRGGNGGDGGTGGRGGDGHDGAQGKLDFGDPFDPCVPPTAGGIGADGAPGGDGGNGTDGGNGANLFFGGDQIALYRMKTMTVVDIPTKHGYGGIAGDPGRAGINGNDGDAADPFCSDPFFSKKPNARAGDFFYVTHPGDDGKLDGTPGAIGQDKLINRTELF